MFGERPACLFLVFSNPGPGGEEALGRWYMEVHGPDAFRGGVFSALHRYEAVGDYDARFLAIWEGPFRSKEEARARMVPGSSRLKEQGRITEDLIVVWSDMHFLGEVPAAGGPVPSERPEVGTLTLAEGGAGGAEGTLDRLYRYGDLVLSESPDPPELVVPRWRGGGKEGMAPHGPYRNLFADPGSWLAETASLSERWVSHWRPIGSLRPDDVRL
jgi:hypothetical protein